MPFARLREILQGEFTATISSTQADVDKVQAMATARRQALVAAGKPAPRTKPAQLLALPINPPSIQFRAIDVLRKIGELTTPQWANMARLSSSWATRRYFWAIAAPRRAPDRFRLNPECRDLDFHQKTLMSDEFGVGFAGLAMEQLFNCDSWVDVSVALADRQRYQNVLRRGRLQPDYLMWRELPGEPYYVVECKGSQSQRNVSLDQIRRGLEQVPSLRFAGGARRVERFVVATLIQTSDTTVFIIDPEDEETPEERERRLQAEKSERTSEKLSDNVWFIPNPERFEDKAADVQSAQLLKWAGQYRSAAEIEASIEIAPRRNLVPEDRPMDSFVVGEFTFDGFRVPLFPELRGGHLNVFLGVERETLEVARRERGRARAVIAARVNRLREIQHQRRDGFASLGNSGTCLAIEGL